jgi:hypothetical protein
LDNFYVTAVCQIFINYYLLTYLLAAAELSVAQVFGVPERMVNE